MALMLTLDRHNAIIIDDTTRITLALDSDLHRVKLQLDAPKHIRIKRSSRGAAWNSGRR